MTTKIDSKSKRKEDKSMLKKLITGVIVANFAVMLIGVFISTDNLVIPKSYANTTADWHVTANVEEMLAINAELYPLDVNGEPDWENPASEVNFGTLEPVYVNDTLSHFMGTEGYAVVMYPITSGRPYDLYEESGPLYNTVEDATIPDGAYVMIPDFIWDDQYGGPDSRMPTGASISEPVSAVGINNHIYTSGPDGDGAAVRAYLGIPADPEDILTYSRGSGAQGHEGVELTYDDWEPITVNQPPGDYDADVIFTITLQP